jgi:hypothetical protein
MVGNSGVVLDSSTASILSVIRQNNLQAFAEQPFVPIIREQSATWNDRFLATGSYRGFSCTTLLLLR